MEHNFGHKGVGRKNQPHWRPLKHHDIGAQPFREALLSSLPFQFFKHDTVTSHWKGNTRKTNILHYCLTHQGTSDQVQLESREISNFISQMKTKTSSEASHIYKKNN